MRLYKNIQNIIIILYCENSSQLHHFVFIDFSYAEVNALN